MRLSEYPYVVVRIACSKCARKGQYRLARLADKYGSEMTTLHLIGHLAGDCERRDLRTRTYDYCGAYLPDLSSGRPPDRPPSMNRPRLVG